MSYSDGGHFFRLDMTTRGHAASGKTPDEIRVMWRITHIVTHNMHVSRMRQRMVEKKEKS